MSHNQMIPFNQLPRELQRGGFGAQQLLHNTGSVYLDRETAPNVAIYNAPGGTVNIIASPSAGSSSGRYYCDQHNMSFDSWSEHVGSYNHRYCPIPGCAKSEVDFGSDSRFCQHYRNKH